MISEPSNNIAVYAAVISALAAIASAIISALISYSVSKRAASQKIAEMRQLWIEDLRTHVARFGSKSASVVSAKLHDKPFPKEDFQFDYHYIILKLNLDETKHNELYVSMNELMAIANEAILSGDLTESQKTNLNDRFHTAIVKYTKLASSLFREEWHRLKLEIRETSKN